VFLGGLLRARGVRAIGITSSDEKALVAAGSGHSNIVNYRTTDVVQAVHSLEQAPAAHELMESGASTGKLVLRP
jgi:NADPH:quinone reductase-like Zn-dependent oxidoreductase